MNRRDVLTSMTMAGAAIAATTAPAAAQVAPAGPRIVTTTSGAELFIRDYGTGAPVLFVHSWALNSEMWEYQINALTAAGHRCIAYDRRGHGRSPESRDGYSADLLADDLAAVIDAYGLTEITLIGHSLGCAEIARYAARHGTARVKRIALLSPITPFLLQTDDNPMGAPRAVMEASLADLRADRPAAFAKGMPGFFGPNVSPAMMDWGMRMILSSSAQAVQALVEMMFTTDFRPDVAKIDRPTLVIHGDQDQSSPLPITGQRTAEMIPGAVFKVYEGEPHGLIWSARDRLNADLLAFLQ